MPKVALITGITGQDGSYLAELLLFKGYAVHGMIRSASHFNTARIDHIFHRITLHYGDLVDSSNLVSIISKIRPDEVYNLGAQSHVLVSFETPEYTGNADGLGTLRLLEAIRVCRLSQTTRFYQASTSELYGNALENPQTESTPFRPRSPYGVAKLFAHWTVVNHREAYNMFAVNGILFNHESPRRGGTFVTKKIVAGIAGILGGKQSRIVLGNLDAKRDWGHARDYVRAMWLMLQQPTPQDFVICSGYQISVRDFVTRAFKCVDMHIEWNGIGIHEEGSVNGKVVVSLDLKYHRPTEVESLLGNSEKARTALGWVPEISVDELIEEMIRVELANASVLIPRRIMGIAMGA